MTAKLDRSKNGLLGGAFLAVQGVRFWPRKCKAKNGPLPKVGRGVRLWSVMVRGVPFFAMRAAWGPFLEFCRHTTSLIFSAHLRYEIYLIRSLTN